MSSLSTFATTLRGGLRGKVGLRNGSGQIRGFYASPAALKKARSSQSEDNFETEEYEQEQDEEDLFDAPSRSSSSTPLDKSAIRQSNVAAILAQAKKAEQDRKSLSIAGVTKSKSTRGKAVAGVKKEETLSDHALRQVVACSEGEEQVAELKKVVRAWKVAGKRVSKRTGAEIVGRLCNIGQPEIAAELVSNQEQYGLPDLDQPTLIKLHHSLLSSSRLPPKLPSTQPVSPTLTLLRLSLLQQKSADPSVVEQESSRLLSSKKARSFKATQVIEGLTEEAREALRSAGGEWEKVLKKVVV
ncbi:hypothetical protein CI109_106142 [Kwoniella shandongensis]|uniref:Uncharacterized protein n=1 Tax=Kwoniella shandongensis TaxID=1734106 RepID=A0A5M6C3H1_9TREE|nr:uncharacterized protein CI109_003750 [Kwoniella shandongensis]KAA5527779.1 hypothetical protein CI109_003750 [Kwoniella shandongensis]